LTETFSLLSEALGISAGQLVALVGGGGKTRALLTLSRELTGNGWLVLASTTTRVGGSVETAMPVVTLTGEEPPDDLVEVVSRSGRAFLSSGRGADGKLLGVDPWVLTDIRERGLVDVVVVEADGARQLPLKAPGEREPIVPGGADLVSPVAGLDALGRRIEPGAVHRPELVRKLTDSDVVTPEGLASVLTSDEGGLKGTPPGAEVRPILNKLDAVPLEKALEAAEAVLAAKPERIRRVLLTSLLDSQYLVVTPRQG
jgi:probable selenium-dependent hydroxylase accessory protein YqeC